MPGDITLLLQRSAGGDDEAAHELYQQVYGELHGMARAYMGAGANGHTLQPTALVNEAWLRMAHVADADEGSWQDRKHFLAVAARAMRSALVDHARRRNADKRGGNRGRIPLEIAIDLYQRDGVDLLELDDALERLASDEPRQARVVELRFFGGLKLEEIADALEVSAATVDRAWRMARIRLREELRSE